MQLKSVVLSVCAVLIFFPTLASAAEELKSDVLLASPRATVTTEDIERYTLENLPRDENQRAAILSRNGIYKEMVESLYVMRALAAEAEAAPGYDEAQAKWAAKMAYQRKLVNDYRKSYMAEVLKDVNWDVVALEQYNVSPEKYMQEERVAASHILIKTKDRSDEDAKVLAEELHARLLSGEDFGAMAKEHSEDGSAKKGGSLGYFQRGKMVEEFEEAAFALEKAGDISEPIKSQFGYHIIRLDDRKPAIVTPFKQVKPRIIKSLRAKMGDQAWQDKLIRLRSSKDIVLNQEAIDALGR